MFWWVNREYKRWKLVYDGDPANLWFVLDQNESINRFKNRPAKVETEEFTIDVFGKKHKVALPLYTDKSKKSLFKNITKDFEDHIVQQAKDRFLDDVALGIWMKLLFDYRVIVVDGYICFYPKTIDEKKVSQVSRDVKARIGLQKEFMDGYIMYDPYKYKHWKQTTEIPMSSNYEFKTESWIINIPFNYTVSLRKAMFYNQMQSIGAKKFLMDWQYDVVTRMWRRTFILWPRRSGKTFLLAFLARREIMKQSFAKQNLMRPINVVYIGLTDAKNLKVVNYLKGMDREFQDNKGMFIYSSGDMIYRFKSGNQILGEITFVSSKSDDPGIGDYADLIIVDEGIKMSDKIFEGIEPIVDNEWAKLISASTLYYDSPKNYMYKRLVEAEMKSIERHDIVEYINSRWTKFEEFSTNEEWTPDMKRTYWELVDQFLDNNDVVGLRYNIDDIEYMPQRKKDKVKSDYWERNPSRYYAELYSRYADDNKVFKYSKVLTQPEKLKQQTYDLVVNSHDSALTKDHSAVLVGWRNKALGKVMIMEEHKLEKTWKYEDQAKQVKEIMKWSEMYVMDRTKDPNTNQLKTNSSKNWDVHFVCDGTQKATPELFEMAGVPVHCKVAYNAIGSEVRKSTIIANEWKVPKKHLIDIAQKMIDNWFVLINNELKNLLGEFDWFYKKLSKSGTSYVFEGQSTDDFVNSFLIMMFYFYDVLWLKHSFTEEQKTINPKMDHKELVKFKQGIYKNSMDKKFKDFKQKSSTSYYNQFIY